MGNEASVVAVDVGASGGRVLHLRLSSASLAVHEVARFENRPVLGPDGLHWDAAGLLDRVTAGIGEAVAEHGPIDSVALDTWGVDYGLVRPDGTLAGPPFHYRDRRTEEALARRRAIIDDPALYARTGTAPLALQTIHQLLAESEARDLDGLECLLMPDLLAHGLTGRRACERTNASTTGLFDPVARVFDDALLRSLGLPLDLFSDLVDPGEVLGPLLPAVAQRVGATGPVLVRATASHDTASAVVAMPALTDRAAFLSLGTWSIIGLELERPLRTPESLAAGFSNELGVDDTVRYVRNAAGLWLLQECIAAWGTGAEPIEQLIAAAVSSAPWRTIIDPDHASLVAPGHMAQRLAAEAERVGEPVPRDRGELVRCILDSLAVSYRRHLRTLMTLTGREIDRVHILGGGSRNTVLCQLTADACGLPVTAGPAEASALGNALVQGRALVMPGASLGQLRALAAAHLELAAFVPQGHDAAWADAEARQLR